MRLSLRAPFGRANSLPANLSNQGFEPGPPSPPYIKKAPEGACLFSDIVIASKARSGLFGASMRLSLRAPFGRANSLPANLSNQGFEPGPPSPPYIKKAPEGACLFSDIVIASKARSGLFGASMRLSLRAPFGRANSLPANLSNQGFEPGPPSPPYIKKAPEGACFMYGGEGGIRTPGPFRVNGFQDHRFRPLSHLSEKQFLDTRF